MGTGGSSLLAGEGIGLVSGVLRLLLNESLPAAVVGAAATPTLGDISSESKEVSTISKLVLGVSSFCVALPEVGI